MCWCDTREKALEVESLIVRPDDEKTMNVVAGGAGGNSVSSSSERVVSDGLTEVERNIMDCFSDMRGTYDERHLFEIVKRDFRLTHAFSKQRDFSVVLKNIAQKNPEILLRDGSKSWSLK